MAIPQGTQIPKSTGQFAKLQDGLNKFRVLSDIIVGWEGWKDKKPFRHPGNVCKIKPEQVDLNQNGNPSINYFWAMVVWNYRAEKDADGNYIGKVQVLELTQKTIMSPLDEMEKNEDWGDLKNYDITINKKKDESGKTSYMVLGIPPKPLANEIKKAYEETEVDLNKLFEGGYPMGEEPKTVNTNDDDIDPEAIPF